MSTTASLFYKNKKNHAIIKTKASQCTLYIYTVKLSKSGERIDEHLPESFYGQK